MLEIYHVQCGSLEEEIDDHCDCYDVLCHWPMIWTESICLCVFHKFHQPPSLHLLPPPLTSAIIQVLAAFAIETHIIHTLQDKSWAIFILCPAGFAVFCLSKFLIIKLFFLASISGSIFLFLIRYIFAWCCVLLFVSYAIFFVFKL